MKNTSVNMECHSTGISLFDKYHLELLDAVAQLERHFDAEKPSVDHAFRKDVCKLIRKLGNYFADQEQWMRAAGFCGYEIEKKSHSYFLRRVERAASELENNPERAWELSCFLKTWLIAHIRGINEKMKFAREQKGCFHHNSYEITTTVAMPLLKPENVSRAVAVIL